MPKKIAPREEMPRQAPEVRARNFDEVALGYDPDQAVREANRCLRCKNSPCVNGCPVGIDIPEIVRYVSEEKFPEAAALLKRQNALPAICGRVCPQEEQCEKLCLVGKLGEPVAIGRIERFIADWEAANKELAGLCELTMEPPPALHLAKVAVIGAGPAGLTAAGELACLGYDVTLFEALHEPGGVLTYGIPDFRLPREILRREVEYVQSLGVDLQTNVVIGKTLTLQDLFDRGYSAMFIGTGAGLPQFLKIPGENLNGIYTANEFLTRINLMHAREFPEYVTPIKLGKKIAVIGAGNVAMDAARCSLRLGAEEVTVIYRRSRAEMPARNEEIENAEEEGVKFQLLTNPTRFLGNAYGWLNGIECVRMDLGEPDASGRRRPVPIEGSEFVIEIDTAIIAVGQSPNPMVHNSAPDLQTTKWGGIVTDEETGATSIPGVYAGGDAVSGAATVISAMGAGKKAAHAIDRYIRNKMDAASPE